MEHQGLQSECGNVSGHASLSCWSLAYLQVRRPCQITALDSAWSD